ncbi:MAG: hypothetical protein IPM06_18810 [Rhizobiales bacterium]|nr:hypothetical protein [Hyphomicrobiales bacterium]
MGASVPGLYGDLTSRLYAKQVREVITNGHLLKIVTSDNSELTIAWVDGEGRPIKGHPVVVESGARLKAEGIKDVMYLPQIRTRGEA